MSPQAETVVVLDASCSNFDPNFAGLRITFTQRTAYSITSWAMAAE